MSINEIARTLLNLRENRMTSFIMAGELREALGFDGYSEALRRRWITPDETGSGMITVTSHLSTVEEIRRTAQEGLEVCDTCKKESCKCKCKDGTCTCTCEAQQESITEGAHFLATSHAFRPRLNEYATMGLGRTGDAPETPVPGLGSDHTEPTTTTTPPVSAAGAGQSQMQQHPYSSGQQPQPGSLAANMDAADKAARERFGKSYAQLTPEEQAQIEQQARATAATGQ